MTDGPAPRSVLAPADAYEEAQRLFVRMGSDEDAARVFELTRLACGGGIADACVAEAVLLRNGIGTRQDLGRAIDLLARGCDGGHAAACTELGVHYDRPWGVPWDEARARALYRAGAEGGDDEGLVLLARLEHASFREPEGIALADEACRAGNPRGCLFAFDADVLARKSPMGEARACDAPAALERDCRAGSIRTAARSCLALWESGTTLYDDFAPDCRSLAAWKHAQPDAGRDERTVGWARAACELRSVEGCGKLGFDLDETPEGVGLLHEACDHDDLDACEWLAYLYFHDWDEGPFDRPKSIELYARVCERGARHEACRMWAAYCGDDTFRCPAPESNADDDAPRSDVCGTGRECATAASAARLGGDPARGAELYEEACRLGWAEACFRLGDMHTTGELGKRRIDDAIVHYARACDLGHAMGCMSAGAYRFDSSAEKTEACAWLARACELGEEGGCELAKCAAGG